MVRAVTRPSRITPSSLLWLGFLACASSPPQTLESAMASDHPPRSILVGISPPPRPATSPMEFFLGPIPNMAAGGGQTGAGERLLQAHRIVDPAPEIARALTTALALRRHLEVKPPRHIDDSRTIRKHFRADLVLDVTTEKWDLRDTGSSLAGTDRVRLFYQARLELYDTRTQETLASGECLAPTLKLAAAPSWKELEANDAEVLKRELRHASNYCLRHFGRRILAVWLDGTHGLYGETDPPVRDEAPVTHEPQ